MLGLRTWISDSLGKGRPGSPSLLLTTSPLTCAQPTWRPRRACPASTPKTGTDSKDGPLGDSRLCSMPVAGWVQSPCIPEPLGAALPLDPGPAAFHARGAPRIRSWRMGGSAMRRRSSCRSSRRSGARFLGRLATPGLRGWSDVNAWLGSRSRSKWPWVRGGRCVLGAGLQSSAVERRSFGCAERLPLGLEAIAFHPAVPATCRRS